MTDLLLAVGTAALLVAVGLALLSALTLAPFVVALQMAEARRFSTARWGALTLAGTGVALLLVLVLVRGDRLATPIALLPLLLTWGGPAALWLLAEQDTGLGGRAGRHEQPG